MKTSLEAKGLGVAAMFCLPSALPEELSALVEVIIDSSWKIFQPLIMI